MKKLFTLIAAMMLFVGGAFAKNDFTPTKTEIQFTKGWSWTNITPEDYAWPDLTDLTYLVVKYSSSTTDVNVIIQYDKTGETNEWGDVYNQSQATGSAFADGGLIVVPLDPDHKAKISQVAVQNQNNTGNFIISEIYFANNDECDAAKAEDAAKEKQIDINPADVFSGFADGILSVPADPTHWNAKWLGKDVSNFKAIVFEFGKVTVNAKLNTQGTENVEIPINVSEEPVTIGYNFPDGYTKFNQVALQVNEEKALNVEIKRIYLTTKTYTTTGINDAIAAPANDNAPMYNLAGQKVDNSYKGVVIKNGKKFFQK